MAQNGSIDKYVGFKRRATFSVTLRDSSEAHDTRYLGASISTDGTLTINGQDLGPGVEKIFGHGCREYEWSWKSSRSDIQQLISALNAGDDVLAGLARRFSGDSAAELKPFLDEHGIRYESWSRIGD